MAKRKLSTEELKARAAANSRASSNPRDSPAPESAPPTPEPAPPADPFPAHLLPVPVAEFVSQGADVLVVPLSYVGLPALTVMAACIGTTRRVIVKGQFVEPTTLWTGVIGSTGSRKSGGYKLAMKHLVRRQFQWRDQHEAEMAEWETEQQVLAETGKGGGGRARPVERQIWTADTTVDALTDLMSAGNRGALQASEEMDGWIAGLSRYTATSERAHWLQFYDGSAHITNRRKDKQPKYVRAASVCITGGIQPLVLQRNLTPDHIAAGMYGRFMFGREPEPEPQFHEREIHPGTEREWERVVDGLLALEHGRDADEAESPIHYRFTRGALDYFGPWFVRWQKRRQKTKNPGLQASRGKLIGQAVRLALVMHTADVCWRQAIGQGVRPNEVADEWVIRATGLAEWVDAQAVAIYGEENVNAGLLARLQQIGKPVSPRDLVTAKVFPTTVEAEHALRDLVAAQKGEWSKSGKKKVFSLFEF